MVKKKHKEIYVSCYNQEVTLATILDLKRSSVLTEAEMVDGANGLWKSDPLVCRGRELQPQGTILTKVEQLMAQNRAC